MKMKLSLVAGLLTAIAFFQFATHAALAQGSLTLLGVGGGGNATITPVTLAGQGIWIPSRTEQSLLLEDAFANQGTITSSNASSQIALMGTVYQYGTAGCFTGTKNIQSFYFLLGSLTNGGTPGTVKFSVQGQSIAAGPPARPDGTILASGNAFSTAAVNTLTGGAWTHTPNFGTVAPVTCGQPISIVFNWSSAGVGSSFSVSGSTTLQGNAGYAAPIVENTNDSVTWTPANDPPDIVLAFDDGTFGTFTGSSPTTGRTNESYNSGSSPNEYGCSIKLPFAATASGMTMAMGFPSTAPTMTLELTDGASTPNVLATVNLNAKTWLANAGGNSVPFTGYLTFHARSS